MRMMQPTFLLTVLLLTVSYTCAQVNLSRALDISNESGHKLQVYWIQPQTGEAVRYADVKIGAKAEINSFVNHTFMVRDDTEECTDITDDCHVNYITVRDGEERQLAHVKEGLEVEYEEASNVVAETTTTSSQDDDIANKLVEKCKAKAAARLSSADPTRVLNDMTACVESSLARLLETKNNEIAVEAKDRLAIADQLENYTCADHNLPTTPPKEIRQWNYNGTVRQVHVLHERRASQIHVLQNFISAEECQAIQEAAEPKLHRGTVADGSGGSKLSEHRKAFQAGLSVPWDKEAEGHPIARVVRRLYDYTNHATGFNLSVVGQEDLMSIQYFGNGDSDPTPDQYRPHCDGDCDGKIHKEGGRVATMVMYCDVPEKGGATNFGHAGVTAQPQVGAAAFFSYMDNETRIKDSGWTSHSGCPVIEGTKRIAVQWMRLGVDEENPWDSFNTLTIKRKDAEDC